MAQAAGLGKLTVYSGLGQPLRAELEVSANADELNGMTARLAPREVFQQAGVDFSAALNDLRFAVEKSRSGASIVKLSSVRPINEPFLDFLVELNWPAGRLVREYTFLLDPPGFSNRQAAPAVADGKLVDAPVVSQKPYTMAPTPGTVVKVAPPPVSTAAPLRPQPAAEAKPMAEARPVTQPRPKTDAPQAKPVEPLATHTVEKGENLRKIAAEHQFDGVSLEQMLVGLYRDNPDAFIGKDIHRLKAGAILNLPNRERVEAVSQAEAKKVYLASGNFEVYRRKLASAAAQAPATEAAESAQASGGKITPKLDDKAASKDASRDQVKVARTDVADREAKAAASDADRLAQIKALKEAEARVGQLEKNVEELQKLLDRKSTRLNSSHNSESRMPSSA
jgi:pilus assembly protein FimV